MKPTIFVCCADMHQSTLAERLEAPFRELAAEVYVGRPTSRVVATDRSKRLQAAKECKIFVPLVDTKYFLASKDRMTELRTALGREECLIFPVLLSRVGEYASAVTELAESKSFEKWEGWSEEMLKDAVSGLERCEHQLRVFETATFQVAHIAKAVLEPKEALTVLGLSSEEKRERLKAIEASCSGPSVFRLTYPIQASEVPAIQDESVPLYAKQIESISDILLKQDKSVGIVGVKGAGGVGKTWLARRIANAPELAEVFYDGILFMTFGEETKTNNPALRTLWSELGGEDAKKSEIDVGEFRTARRLFTELVHIMDPKALLILDDIWDARVLKVLDAITSGNVNLRVLVTSRQEDYIVQAFGRNGFCHIESLNAGLSPEDALQLMSSHASGLTLEEDKESMLRIAKQFGYHAKTLSIVANLAIHSSTWRNFAENLAEGVIEKAANTVKTMQAIVRYTFKTAFAAEPRAPVKFSQLGVFVEDARFTKADLQLLWNVKRSEVELWLNRFVGCSIIECEQATASLGSDTADSEILFEPTFYLHDLVRECARKYDEKRTKEYEREFEERIREHAQNQKEKITKYMFEWVLLHLGICDEEEMLDRAYEESAKGEIQDSWSANQTLILRAIRHTDNTQCLALASAKLCRDNIHFFRRVVRLQQTIR